MKKICKILAIVLIAMFALVFTNVDAKIMDAGTILDITAKESNGKKVPIDVYVLGNYAFYNYYSTADVLMAMNDFMLNNPVGEHQELKLLVLSAEPYNVGAVPEVKIENALDAEEEIDEEDIIINLKKIYNLDDAEEVAENANEDGDIAETEKEKGKDIVVFADSYFVTMYVYDFENQKAVSSVMLKDEGDELTLEDLPENPYEDEENYVFTGWYYTSPEEEYFKFVDPIVITGNLDLYAEFEGKEFEVTYHGNGGYIAESEDVEKEVYDAYMENPEESEYYNCYEYTYNDELLYACATLAEEVTVNERYDSYYNPPMNTEGIGYELEGWYSDQEGTTPQPMLVEDVTITDFYAKWTPSHYTSYQILHRYMEPNGVDYEEEIEYDFGTTGDMTAAEVRPREGFIIPEVVQLEIACDGSTEVIIEYLRDNVAVTFQVDEDTNEVQVIYGTPVARPEDPEKEGFVFTGWTLNGVDYDFDALVTEPITLVAEFNADQHTISYDVNPEEIEYLDTVAQPKSTKVTNGQPYGTAAQALASLAGYEFVGWFLDENYTAEVTPETIVNLSGNAILFAKWSPKVFEVTLDDGIAATENEVIEVTFNAEMPEITVPQRDGYTFNGYFNGGNASGTQYYSSEGTSVHVWDQTASTVIYADYTPNQYTVSYSLAGSGLENPPYTTPVTFDSAYGELADPTEALLVAGYDFGGWYLESTWENEVTSETIVAVPNDHTLYAKINAHQYTITYKGKANSELEGTDEYKTTYTVEEGFDLVNPVREGYTFGGWFTDAEYSGDAITAVAVGTKEDLVFYAKWDATEATVAAQIATVQTKANTILTWYNNKGSYNDIQELSEEEHDVYYTPVEYLDLDDDVEIASVRLNTYTYNQDRVKLSVGNSSYIDVPVWEYDEEEGMLYVANPWLFLIAIPGTTVEVTAYDEFDEVLGTFVYTSQSSTSPNNLTAEVEIVRDSTYKPDLDTTDDIITTNALLTYDDETDEYTLTATTAAIYVGAILKNGDEYLNTAAGIPVYRFDKDLGSIGLEKSAEAGVAPNRKMYNYGVYAIWKGSSPYPFTPEEIVPVRTLHYMLALPGVGYTNLTFNRVRTVDPIVVPQD